MNEVERYLRDVMHNIQAPPRDRARIEADLKAHLEAAIEAGEDPSEVLAHMGTPAEVAAEFMSGVSLRYAGFWRRLAAFVVDSIISLFIAGLFTGLGIWLMNLANRALRDGNDLARVPLFALSVSLGIIAVGVYILYFPVLEGRFGYTLGKRLLGLRVVKENGAPIGFKEAFLRRLSLYFRFLFLDALFIFFTEKRQRAFDIVARTVVIKETP